MKKNFCKALAMLFVVFMMMNTVAFAETTEVEPAAGPGINAPDGEENIITVTLSGLTGGEEATILVVNDGVVGVEVTENEVTRTTTLADVADTDIVYINQETIPDGGIVTFELDASNATGDKVDIFCGYTSIEAAADVLVAEDVTISAVSAPVINMENEANGLYEGTDVFGKTGYRRMFIKLSTGYNASEWTPVLNGAEVYYSEERDGYDVVVSTTKNDFTAIADEIVWTNIAPTEAMTIKKYGNVDLDADNALDASDLAEIKLWSLGLKTLTTKAELCADVDNDSSISSGDIAEMKQLNLHLIDAYSIVKSK